MKYENAKLLVEKINEYQNIIIAKHIAPDWDAQGSALGLKEIIVNNFKNKNVYVVGNKLMSAGLFEDEQVLTEDIIKESLMITVDVANFERIDFSFKDNVKEIFKIDHHPNVDDYADNSIVDVASIACTQTVVSICEQNNWKISKEAATYLYYGLITDSGRFLFRKTNEITFKTAIKLIECGVDINEVYENLYSQPLVVAKWKNRAFNKAKFVEGYPIAYIEIKDEDWQDLSLTEEEVKLSLGTLSGIQEILIWFIAYESKVHDAVKVSMRSRQYEVNKVAAVYSGGGHMYAAGAKVKDFKDVDNLVNDLKKLVDNNL
ncbi:DHH family phosphoesterase [Spiroplasma culicicola]|uniref:DHH family protein n=1 Tax=Spiroplasma culicicola AES-1 TaxID=1276246 RepID=W6AI37_9MOLU|nr:bifunctional oligoribonuclease/PAP phosphatase NrnA [Spiroplasma culicicola]AHI53369.1 DHH family protein [Spiroplasma culicicola AES-1]